jgi:hypothetical protein
MLRHIVFGLYRILKLRKDLPVAHQESPKRFLAMDYCVSRDLVSSSDEPAVLVGCGWIVR